MIKTAKKFFLFFSTFLQRLTTFSQFLGRTGGLGEDSTQTRSNLPVFEGIFLLNRDKVLENGLYDINSKTENEK